MSPTHLANIQTMPKLIILTGAPSSSALNRSTTPLLTTFTAPLTSLLSDAPHSSSPSPSMPPTPSAPAWRSLPLRKTHLHTDLTQPSIPSFLHPEFAAPQTPYIPSQEEPSEDLRSQFYEYSLSIYDSHPTSTSFHHSIAPSFQTLGYPTRATDLISIPKPPSPPLTLLVAIVSTARKTVTTRHGERALVEALVGDDTRSAFQLTLWLGDPRKKEGILARDLEGLRVGDVVLVQNVGVAVFRGRVYAQSVAGGMDTRVRLLYREPESDDEGEEEEEEGGGCERALRNRVGHYSWEDMVVEGPVHPQLGKTRRVRRWMRGLLGEDGGGVRDGDDGMPDDTLE